MIKHVGEVRLQKETGQRIPVQRLAYYVLFDLTSLQLRKRFFLKEPLAVNRCMHEIVACHQS